MRASILRFGCACGGTIPSADQMDNRMVSLGGIEASTEIIGVLRRGVGGMPEDGLSDTDMRGIPDRELGRHDFSE